MYVGMVSGWVSIFANFITASFSFVDTHVTVTDEMPYVVTHHSFTTLLALVAPFKIFEVLVKAFALFFGIISHFPLENVRVAV